MLYAAWVTDPFRMTRNLDLLSFADREDLSLLKVIRDICAQPVEDDGLRYDTENIGVEPFSEDRTHGALRVRTSARLNVAVIPVHIDVGFGDAITPGPLELEYPVLLDHPVPALKAHPRETATAVLFLWTSRPTCFVIYSFMVCLLKVKICTTCRAHCVCGQARLACTPRYQRQTTLPTRVE